MVEPSDHLNSDMLISAMKHVLLSRRTSPAAVPPGPPYVPNTAALGGQPTISLDVPITSVFLVLFLLGAISHMTIFQLNRRRGHKFLMSGALFGFCMARTITCVMRIIWATFPDNVSVAIAASVLVAAGVIILFIVNLVFAQRIIRAGHPWLGWHSAFDLAFKALYALIIISLVILISFTVQIFYTLDPVKRKTAHDLQLYGGTLFAAVAFLPIPLVLVGFVLPRRNRVEKFGSGRYRSKIIILITATALLSLGAWFRVGTNYLTPRPSNDPGWYESKACFYIFDFGVEILVIWLYIIIRVDRRFHIPNGSKRPGDYTGKMDSQDSGVSKMDTRIMSEEEVFDNAPEGQVETKQETLDVESARKPGTI